MTPLTHRPRVLMLGIDAAEADVVETLLREDRLPNLKLLRDGGFFGRLTSPAGCYAGGVWPTFYTGRSVPSHGIYHSKLWRADQMRVDVVSDDWLEARPFWERLPDPDLKVCIVDVPMVLGAPRRVAGVYLGGWGTHDLISRGSWPPELWRACEKRFGRPAMPAEDFGRQSERSLRRLPLQLAAATKQLGAVAIELLQRDSWDFGCIVFGATHRGGHYLWDRSQLADRAAEPSSPEVAEGLIGIYQDIDRALGEILHAVGESTLVVAFALHGMGPNPGWSDLLPGILARVEEHRTGLPPRRGMLYRLKQRLPFHRVRPLLNRLPTAITHRLVSLWSRNMFDWSSTRFFPLPMDEAGLIRINLRGRERGGIVEPGAEYDALCGELAAVLLDLRDDATGRPIARDVSPAYASAPADAAGRELLPDLVVTWTGATAATVRRLTCPSLPGFEYPVPQRLPSGRSGNHTDHGWFIARGPGIAAGETCGKHDVIDLAPTVLHHLGVPIPEGMEGTPIRLGTGR